MRLIYFMMRLPMLVRHEDSTKSTDEEKAKIDAWYESAIS